MLKIENIKYKKADMRFIKDLRGRNFGRLIVLKDEPIRIKGQTYWNCKCICGNIGYIFAGNLTKGKIRSCGCILEEHRKKLYKYAIGTNRKYPMKSKRLYDVYKLMKKRCYDKNCRAYKNYGARGVKVCNEWLDNFINFYNWAITNGYDINAKRGVYTIDRIDVNGNYEPKNCRFVSIQFQQINRTNNRLITIDGETKVMAEWARKLNVNYGKFRRDCNKRGL